MWNSKLRIIESYKHLPPVSKILPSFTCYSFRPLDLTFSRNYCNPEETLPAAGLTLKTWLFFLLIRLRYTPTRSMGFAVVFISCISPQTASQRVEIRMPKVRIWCFKYASGIRFLGFFQWIFATAGEKNESVILFIYFFLFAAFS